MRSNILSLTFALAIPGLVACGDDNTMVPVDSPPPIDSSPPIDTPTPPMFKGYDADEGGEVRVEYITNKNGAFGTRVTAFLYNNPGSTKFFPYASLSGCTDVSTPEKKAMVFPTATNPVAERDYADPGAVIISGGPMTLTLPRGPAAADPFARVHPANEWFFKGPNFATNDGTTYLTEKTKYDVIFTGSADMPGQVFEDVLYMPAAFDLLTPTATVDPIALPATGDQVVTWTTPAQDAPAGYEVMSLVGVTGPMGPVAFCIEPNDGNVTFPEAMITAARTVYGGTTATLARQTLTHVVRELVDENGPTGRRIDFVSVWCYATDVTFQ